MFLLIDLRVTTAHKYTFLRLLLVCAKSKQGAILNSDRSSRALRSAGSNEPMFSLRSAIQEQFVLTGICANLNS